MDIPMRPAVANAMTAMKGVQGVSMAHIQPGACDDFAF